MSDEHKDAATTPAPAPVVNTPVEETPKKEETHPEAPAVETAA